MSDKVKGEGSEGTVSFLGRVFGAEAPGASGAGAAVATPEAPAAQAVDPAAYAAALARIAQLEDEKREREELESSLSKASGQARYRIYVEEKRHSSEIDPVFIGCNGRGYYIKRGYEVDVPMEVVGILENAVQGVVRAVEKGGVDFITSVRFPFRKIGLAVDDNGNRLLPVAEQQVEVRPN